MRTGFTVSKLTTNRVAREAMARGGGHNIDTCCGASEALPKKYQLILVRTGAMGTLTLNPKTLNLFFSKILLVS